MKDNKRSTSNTKNLVSERTNPNTVYNLLLPTPNTLDEVVGNTSCTTSQQT